MAILHLSTSNPVINLSYSMAGLDLSIVGFVDIGTAKDNLKQAVQYMALKQAVQYMDDRDPAIIGFVDIGATKDKLIQAVQYMGLKQAAQYMNGRDPAIVGFVDIGVTKDNLKETVQCMAAIKKDRPDEFKQQAARLFKDYKHLRAVWAMAGASGGVGYKVNKYASKAVPVHRLALQAVQMARVVARYDLGADSIAQMLDERKDDLYDTDAAQLKVQLGHYHHELGRRFGV